jgi:hypothetical protein
MKLLITSLVALLAFNTHLIAQGQVEYSAGLGQRAIHDSGGAPVANGNQVWLGTFSAGFDELDVQANADNPSTLLANWHPFGDGGTTVRTMFGQPGRFGDTDSSTDPFFAGQKIYLWIFSTDAAAAPASDFNNVNEYGLFSATLATWNFSDQPPPNDLRQINSSEVNQAFFGTIGANLFLATATPVPEPTTLGLLSLAIPVVVLAVRKRRSSQ